MTTREIKFRAWDGETMLYAGSKYLRYNAIDFDGKICTIGDQDLGIYGTEPSVLMQYTGLKDKNGKEIYEGDIVEYISKGKRYTTEMIYDNGFQFKENKSIIRNEKTASLFHSSLVIGNLYENPELINNN